MHLILFVEVILFDEKHFMEYLNFHKIAIYGDCNINVFI